MKSVNRMMVAVLSLMVVTLLSASALGQPIKKDEIFAYLAKGSPQRGSEKAPVVLIEFSDFRCSFCRKFAILGKPSELAAQAAECAGEEGKFWEYHDKLFAGAQPFEVFEALIEKELKKPSSEKAKP
jgi:protein-disulfide isomerase